jgi:hypothetical protein
MKLYLIALLSVLAFAATNAQCPNKCSGHGVCGAHSRCTCYANWQGFDCSERTCAYARAWVDVAYDNDKAHDYAECSARGICDRKSGECKCFDGYTGDACRRIACPNDCSGHGTCETTAEFGDKSEATPHESTADEWYNHLGDETDPGVLLGLNKYAAWDAHKTRACKCDGGWTGIACDKRMCPKGDDPLTTESADGVTEKYEVQSIVVGDGRDGKKADGFFTLSFTDAYGNDWTTRPIRITDPDIVPATTGNANTDVSSPQDVTALEVRAALMEIPNHVFDDVEVNWKKVSETYVSSGSSVAYNQYTVTFISPATSGPQSLLRCNFKGCDFDGCQPRFTGIGSLDNVGKKDSRKCVVRGYIESVVTGDGASVGTAENAECSNRGICNTDDGVCECFDGYTGEACSVQTILV